MIYGKGEEGEFWKVRQIEEAGSLKHSVWQNLTVHCFFQSFESHLTLFPSEVEGVAQSFWFSSCNEEQTETLICKYTVQPMADYMSKASMHSSVQFHNIAIVCLSFPILNCMNSFYVQTQQKERAYKTTYLLFSALCYAGSLQLKINWAPALCT